MELEQERHAQNQQIEKMQQIEEKFDSLKAEYSKNIKLLKRELNRQRYYRIAFCKSKSAKRKKICIMI